MPVLMQGLFAAVHTPLTNDGKLNLAVVEQQAEHLMASGIQGVLVAGCAGEGQSLTLEERKELARRWAEILSGRIRLIVNVSHSSLPEAQELASHAQSIGASAIAMYAPAFFKPRRTEELIAFCTAVAAAAPKTPFFFDHIPDRTGVRPNMFDFLDLARPRIASLAGLIYGDKDLHDLARCLQRWSDRLTIFCAREEMLLAALALGAQAAVGASFNFAAPIYQRLWDEFSRGDMTQARHWQDQANRLLGVLRNYGSIAAGKAVMAALGIDCGPVRLPLQPLNEPQRLTLRRDLEAIGFFPHLKPVSVGE